MFQKKKTTAPLLHEDEDFADAYRVETDPERRRQLLAQYGDEYADKRKVLLEKRYSKQHGQEVDNFLRGYLTLHYLVQQGGRIQKKTAKEAIEALCLDQVEDFGEELLFDELYNAFWRYYCLCDSDRTYNSVLLGFGQITPEKRARKVAGEIRGALFEVPQRLGMESDFALAQQAAKAAFEDHYDMNL